MIDRDFRGIWEQREDENTEQYRRFRDYLDMNPRNITALARANGKEPSTFFNLSSKKNWVERAAAYDRFIANEMKRSALNGTLLAIDADQKKNGEWLEEYERMRVELWEMRQRMMIKVKKMLDFDVGVSVKSARKTSRIKNPQTGKYELHTVSETQTDPRWSWGDVARMTDVIDRLGQEIMNLSPDVIKAMPEFFYELQRNGIDPAEYMRRTTAKLKATS